MSFLASLQSNLQGSYEDERDLKTRIFGEGVRRDGGDLLGIDADADLERQRVNPQMVGVRAAAPDAKASRGLVRTAAVARDGRDKLREQRRDDAELSRTVPFAEHRRDIHELATQRRLSIEETIAWLVKLGRAHVAVEREERARAREAKEAKEDSKASKKGRKPSATSTTTTPATKATSLPTSVADSKDTLASKPLASIEAILLQKDEEIEALQQQMRLVEEKYLAAYARLPLADKKELLAQFKDSTTRTTATTAEATVATSDTSTTTLTPNNGAARSLESNEASPISDADTTTTISTTTQ